MEPDRPRRNGDVASSGRWVLWRYADVRAALDDPRLVAGDEPNDTVGRATRVAVRDAARASLAPPHMTRWQATLDQSARQFAAALPVDEPVDLCRAFAVPWSLSLARIAVGVSEEDVPPLASLARVIFLAAAHSSDGEASDEARAASIELATALATGGGSARAATDVQAFVALSHTLPHFLASAWHALLGAADQAALLRERGSAEAAVDELLRFAGPSRAVFRRAGADVEIGDAHITAGQRVTLMLAAANRDPARFADPDRLDIGRDAAGHVAFGRGLHSCVGSSVIRLAVVVATDALLAVTNRDTMIHDVQWLDGFAIRAPSSLVVT